MKTIVLAEKPSVGKELARVLGCNKKTKSYCEGKDYIVTWAMGHLVELADPVKYNEKWKTWKIDYLPMLPERMKHKVIGRTSNQFKTIKGLFNRKDVKELVIATDAGREGELVARWIMRLGGWKGNFKRLWISSQTDAAIRDGFKNLKPGRDYDNLFRAAECRAEADWIIGLNVTRALCCKHDARLSAGRVQTPTLAIIIDREKEIESFKPQPYWTIEADFGVFKALWQSKKGVTRFKEQEHAKQIADKIRDKDGVISMVTIKDKSEQPPLAYNLTDLQRDANKRLSFSAKKTLQTLQGLYERHKIVTYPRTDSRHITTDMVPTLKDRLKGIMHTRFDRTVKDILGKEIKVTKRFVDNSKVSDHHAIIPTEERVDVNRLSFDEKALWELIVKRFLAVLSPAYKYKSISLTVEVEGETFTARGIQVVDRGWRAIAGADSSDKEDDDDDDIPLQNLSKHTKGDVLPVKKIMVPQGYTKPPARYTEGTLLAAMENPGKFVDGKELKDSIQKGGLGTPATRADIIEKLFSNYYIERNGKQIVPTPQGYELVEIVPELLRSPELTAKWELRLSRIAQGQEKSMVFSKDIRQNAKDLVQMVKDSTDEFKPRNVCKELCPVCGQTMLAVRDKKGRKLLVCRSRSCGYEQNEARGGGSFGDRKPSRKEQAMNRRLINKYTSDEPADTFTLGDLLKASMNKNNNKNNKKKKK